MPMSGNCETGGEIEKAVAIHVPDICSRRLLPEDREIGSYEGNVSIFIPGQRCTECEGTLPWDRCDDLRQPRGTTPAPAQAKGLTSSSPLSLAYAVSLW